MQEMFKQIKLIQRNTMLQAIYMILIFHDFLLGILFLSIGYYILFIITALLLITLVALFYRSYSAIKKPVDLTPFQIDAEKYTFDDIINILSSFCSTSIMSEKEAVCFFEGKISLRILVMYCSNFIKKDYDQVKAKVNRRINKQFETSEWITMEDSNKFMRLNLIVSETANDSLIQLLSQNAVSNMRRVEGILTIAYIQEDSKFLVPVYWGNSYYSDFVKYKRCIEILTRYIFTKTLSAR